MSKPDKPKTEMEVRIDALELSLAQLYPLALQGLEPTTAYKLGQLTSAANLVVEQWRKEHGQGTGKVRKRVAAKSQ